MRKFTLLLVENYGPTIPNAQNFVCTIGLGTTGYLVQKDPLDKGHLLPMFDYH